MATERRDVIRSINVLKEAYMKLSLVKTIENITVQEIVDMANVSRGTFYKHFADIHALAEEVENDLITQWKMVLTPSALSNISKDPYASLLKFYRVFQSTAETISVGQNVNRRYFDKVKEILAEALQNGMAKDTKANYLSSICISGLIVESCYDMVCNPNSPCYHDPEYIAAYVSRFIAGGSTAARKC